MGRWSHRTSCDTMVYLNLEENPTTSVKVYLFPSWKFISPFSYLLGAKMFFEHIFLSRKWRRWFNSIDKHKIGNGREKQGRHGMSDSALAVFQSKLKGFPGCILPHLPLSSFIISAPLFLFFPPHPCKTLGAIAATLPNYFVA